MPNLTFDFTWYRDPKGYQLVPAKPRMPGERLLGGKVGDVRGARIVRNGGPLESYQPLHAFPNLYTHFIDMARSEEGVLKFVQNFGPLTREGLREKGDLVPRLVDQAQEMLSPGTMRLNPIEAWIVTANNETRLKVSPACLLDAL